MSTPTASLAVTRRKLVAAGGLFAALALGGTGAMARAAQADTIDYATGPDDLILGIKIEGGFTLPYITLVQMPEFSLFGDGSIVTIGPTTLQFPGPALPNLRARRVSPEGIQAILAEADTAGLLADDLFLRADEIADAGTTTFTTTANGETVTVSAYALGPDVPPGVVGSVAEIYRRLAEFQRLLGTIDEWLPSGSIVDADNPYEIDRIQIVAVPVGNLQVPLEPAGPSAVWPLEPGLGQIGLPLAETDSTLGGLPEFGEARCATFEGDAATTLVTALTAANAQTAWESEGTSFALFARPLLQNESGCGEPVTDGGTPVATPEG